MKTICTSVFVCFLFFTDTFGQCTVTKTIYNTLTAVHQCQGKHIDSLDQQYTVSGTMASATPMPPGLSGNLSGGVYTIAGVPTTVGTFTFNVATSGGCAAASLASSISIESSQPITFSLTSAVGTNGQSICKGKAIKNIIYNFPYSTVSVAGLPTGLTYSKSGSALTISGTPTTTVAGTYQYTLNAIGACSNGSEKGTITMYDCNKCFAHYSVKDTLSHPTIFLLTIDSATNSFAKTYYWDFGDGTSSTDSSPYHSYTIDTTYNVCLKITTALNDSCTYCHKIGKDHLGNIYRTSGFDIEVRNPYQQQPSQVQTRIEKISSTDAISISPNPSSGHFTIDVPMGKGRIHIFNVLGETIYQSPINNQLSDINLISQPNGIYIVTVQTEEGVISRKVIINN